MGITKALYLCGHTDYGKSCDARIEAMIKKELECGKTPNHLFYGNKVEGDFAFNRRKNNFLFDGVPVLVYSLIGMINSDLEDILAVGNEDTGKIVSVFNEVFDANVKFHIEGSGLDDSVEFAKSLLNLSGDEQTLVIAGDLPYVYDMEPHIDNQYVGSHDCILNLNTQDRVGLFYPRNYHITIGGHPAKEPNVLSANLMRLRDGLFNLLYGGRRTYEAEPDGELSKQNGRKQALKKLFVDDGKWTETQKALGTMLIGKLMWHKMFGKKDGLSLTLEDADKIASYVMDMPTKVLCTNSDPGTLKDLDSLEDFAWMHSMWSLTDDKSTLYPFMDQLEKFKREGTPKVRDRVELTKDFPAYLNAFCEKFGVPEVFKDGRYDPMYVKELFEANGVKDFDMNVLMNDIKLHQKYLKNAGY